MQSPSGVFLYHAYRHAIPDLQRLQLLQKLFPHLQHHGLAFVRQKFDFHRPVFDVDLNHLFGDEVEPVLLDAGTALTDLN